MQNSEEIERSRRMHSLAILIRRERVKNTREDELDGTRV